jgi:hypothetical protein
MCINYNMATIKQKSDIAKFSKSKKYIEMDWKEIRVISSEYPGQSGMTIFSYIDIKNPARKLSYYISKRGKSIGGFSLDNVNRTPNKEEPSNGAHSIALVGGSSLGLEALAGINRGILEDNLYWYNKILTEKERQEKGKIPLHEIVLGVCCYTSNLSIDQSYVYPDFEMGKMIVRKTLRDAHKEANPIQKIYLGQSGVGLNSTVSKIDTVGGDNSWYDNIVIAGVGARFIQYGTIKVLVFINLNSVGLIHDNEQLLHPFPGGSNNLNGSNSGGDIKQHSKRLNEFRKWAEGINPPMKSNTTLSVVITNMQLPHNLKQKIADDLHDEVESMIYPYGTSMDGDTFILASTWDKPFKSGTLEKLAKPLIRESIKSVFQTNDTKEKNTKKKNTKKKNKHF